MASTKARRGFGSVMERARKAVSVVTAAAMVVCMSGLPIGQSQSAWAGESDAPALAAQGLSVQDAQVELYQVQVTGGIGNAIGVGDTLTATATKIKQVQGSTSTVEAVLDEGDEVAYQWQYANTSTTTDSYFFDIEGATSATYTITSDMQGKYLRVKAISQNTVVSTKKPYYGSTQSVSPKGPVQAAAGAVELTSVALVSSLANSMWVGATISPTAKYLPNGTYIEQPVPKEAQLTYTWEVADSASGPFQAFDTAAYPQSSVNASGELVIGADLAGKYVRLKANALMNTVSSLVWPVLPAGVYDLMRITFGFDTLYTGNKIVTSLQAKTLAYENDASFGTTVPPDDPNTTYQWYKTSDEPDSSATWTPIDGATDADLTIPQEAVGCYVKVVATSSKDGVGTSVEKASTSKVLAGGSLQQALEKLEFFHPKPVYGQDSNMNDIVKAKLDSLGFTDVSVKTVSFERSVSVDAAHLNVSTADDETNGDVEFFTYDNPAEASSHNFSSYHQVKVGFELSREGQTPVTFTPTTNIPWNLDAAQEVFDEQTKDLAVQFAATDSAEAVTQNVTLPCRAGILWTTWQSSNPDAIKISRDESSGSSVFDPYTGTVTRAALDVDVTLTASVEATLIDSGDDTLSALDKTFDFPVTVKGNPETIEQMNAALAQAIDKTFVYENVTDSATGAAVDESAITANLQLPLTRVLFKGSGLNSGDYRVTYSTDNESVMKVNGFRGNVLQPLPGAGSAEVNLTVTVAHRTNQDVSYTKTLPYVVSELSMIDIDYDLACMEQVKDSIFAGISEGKQEQDAVTSDLHKFQRAYFDADGNLKWKYDASDASDAQCPVGFTPQTVADVTGSDASYESFVSSHPGVIADGTLRVTRPAHDLGVSITVCLSSDRFGALYERYKADASCSDELKEKFAGLYRQKVTCFVTVKGTQVSNAIREELQTAAEEAQALLEGVAVSADGSDVLQNAQWVDAATKKALEDAITVAQATAENVNATEAQIDEARAALDAASQTFTDAIKTGLRPFASEKQLAALKTAADEAEGLLAGVYASADGTDVLNTRSWAPFDAVDALMEAIDEARELASSQAALDEVAEASLKLITATANFEESIKPGTKKPAATSQASQGSSGKPSGSQTSSSASTATASKVKVGNSYTVGSGKSKATYLVKKVATAKKNGAVWYKSCKVKGKAAVVPATVKIKGGTYKVVRVSAGAFKNLKKLTTVTIGKNVTKVAKSSFAKTPKLKKIVIKGKALMKKASVKSALKGAKCGKLTVKVPAKQKNNAKKVFTKKNLSAPKAVTVK